MAAYLDSSALVKRYVQEPGSATMTRLFAGNEPLIVSAIAWSECLAALARKRHDATLSQRGYTRASAAFVAEWTTLHEIPVTAEIHTLVRDLLDRAPLRGMDAIHLASARWLERQLGAALSFYCSDRKLGAAARAAGLAVVDPAEA